MKPVYVATASSCRRNIHQHEVLGAFETLQLAQERVAVLSGFDNILWIDEDGEPGICKRYWYGYDTSIEIHELDIQGSVG